MPSLLLLEHDRWSRHELPERGGVAILKTGGVAPVEVIRGRLAGRPPDAVGMALLCEGQPYYLSAPGGATYLNAAPRPAMPLHRLRDRDRLTYQGADGESIRAWYLQDSQTGQRYDGAPLGQKCGYCSSDIAVGEEIAACPGCSEMVHTDCLAHGGDKCPRCGMVLAQDDAPWLPDGFPDDSEEDDGWE